jgi:hypothetical protein
VQETVVYKRYPGNSLDQQAAKFAVDPKVAPKSPEVRHHYRSRRWAIACWCVADVRPQEQTEEYPVRLSMMNIHTDHIKSNVLKLLKGTPAPTPLLELGR